jgi:hypothetical protein
MWYTGRIYQDDAHTQGLIIDEKTGENIAVTYDAKNAPIIAAAPEMLIVLQDAKTCFTGHNLLNTATEEERKQTIENFLNWWNNQAVPIIEKLEEITHKA